MSHPKPWLIQAPPQSPPRLQGLTLAVFTPEGVRPSPFWARPEAMEWAVHPVGVPECLRGVMPAEALEGEALSVFMDAMRGRLPADEVGPRRHGGLLAWFQSTERTVVVGLGVHRFTFILKPEKNERAQVKTHIYRGGSLGWQPSATPGLALWMLLFWRNWDRVSTPLSVLLGYGQELLATHGLEELRIRQASAAVFCLVPNRFSLAKRGNQPLATKSVEPKDIDRDVRPYSGVIRSLRVWLARTWMRASKQHPGLAGVRAWLALHSPMDVSRHSVRFVEEGWVREMGVGGSARHHDPRRLTDRFAMLSLTEFNDPRQWLGDWFDQGMWRSGDFLMPSIPAARWWLGLDAKSVTRLCQYIQPNSIWGNMILSTTCHIASRQGPVRVPWMVARMVAYIPFKFWVAYWMVCEPEAWKRMEKESWGVRAESFAPGLKEFWKTIQLARELSVSNPKSVRSIEWVVRLALWGVPIEDQVKVDPNTLNQTTVMKVWEWLWDGANEFERAGVILGRAQKSWTWDTLKAQHAQWQSDQDFQLALGLHASVPKDNSWSSALGQVDWDGCQVVPVCNRHALSLAGQRYLNCMRQNDQLDAAVKDAQAHVRRWFVVKSPTSSALLEIQRAEEGWRVSQMSGQANRQASGDLERVGARVAVIYSMLRSSGGGDISTTSLGSGAATTPPEDQPQPDPD